MTVRVLVIGTGFGARSVAPAFAATAGCEVIDVVSPRDDIAKAMTRPDIDLVSVHSPPFLHAEHVLLAADRGLAVLCDKPCTRSAVETAEMLESVIGSGVVHLVNFEFRYDPTRVALRAAVRDGLVGTVRSIDWRHHSSSTREPLRPYGWLFDRELGGGWIGAWASHAVDTIQWLLSETVHVVHSEPRTDIALRPDAKGLELRCTAEDGLIATLRSESEVEITLDSSFASTENERPRLTIRGDRATVTADGNRVTALVNGNVTELIGARRSSDLHDVAMRRWLPVVRDSVIAATPVDPTTSDAATLYDGLAVDRVLDELRVG